MSLSRDVFERPTPTGSGSFAPAHLSRDFENTFGKSSGYKSRDTQPYKLGCVKELQKGKKSSLLVYVRRTKTLQKIPR